MNKKIRLTLSAEDGDGNTLHSCSRLMRAKWTPEVKKDLRAFHGEESAKELEYFIADVLRQEFSDVSGQMVKELFDLENEVDSE